MPKAGQVRVPMTRRGAAALGAWLLSYEPLDPSLIAHREVEQIDRQRAALRHIGDRLLQAARRRRAKEEFKFLATPEDIASVAGLWPAMAISPGAFAGLSVAAWNGVRIFDAASRRRRGRPSAPHSALERIEAGAVSCDERHRKRASRKARYGRLVMRWGLRNTHMTAKEPFPEN